jgi:hypothetical protein
MAEDLDHTPHHTLGSEWQAECIVSVGRRDRLDRIPHTQGSWPADRIMLGTKSLTLMVAFVGRC